MGIKILIVGVEILLPFVNDIPYFHINKACTLIFECCSPILSQVADDCYYYYLLNESIHRKQRILEIMGSELPDHGLEEEAEWRKAEVFSFFFPVYSLNYCALQQ